jgi:hypothetical protein
LLVSSPPQSPGIANSHAKKAPTFHPGDRR